MNNIQKTQPLPMTQDAPIGLEGAPESGSRAAALFAGLGTAVVAAIITAVVMVEAKLQIDYVAVGLGFVVAIAVRKAGGGNTTPFAMTGVICVLIGCALAEIFTAASYYSVAQSNDTQTVTAVLVVAQMMDDPSLAARLLQENFKPLSLVFYGIAVLEGYKLSRRPRW